MAAKAKAHKAPAVQHLSPDEGAKVGFFAKVIAGPHDGRYGVVQSIGDVHPDGSPRTAVLTTRDDDNASLVVAYEHLRPDSAGKR
jgi:hypothetical protein